MSAAEIARLAVFAAVLLAPSLLLCVWLIKNIGTREKVRAILEQQARDASTPPQENDDGE